MFLFGDFFRLFRLSTFCFFRIVSFLFVVIFVRSLSFLRIVLFVFIFFLFRIVFDL